MGFIIYTESHGWEKAGRCKQGCLPLTQKNLHNLHNLHGVVPEPNPEKQREHYAEASADPRTFTRLHVFARTRRFERGSSREQARFRLCQILAARATLSLPWSLALPSGLVFCVGSLDFLDSWSGASGTLSRSSSREFSPHKGQLGRRLLPSGFTLRAWFGLAAQLGGWNGVAQLPMLFYVAVGTQSHEILERVISLLASLDLVVDLQILQRAALPAPPAVPLQHPLHQAAVNLLP